MLAIVVDGGETSTVALYRKRGRRAELVRRMVGTAEPAECLAAARRIGWLPTEPERRTRRRAKRKGHVGELVELRRSAPAEAAP